MLIKQKRSICEDDTSLHPRGDGSTQEFGNSAASTLRGNRVQVKNTSRPVLRACSFPSDQCAGPKTASPKSSAGQEGSSLLLKVPPVARANTTSLLIQKQRSLNEELLTPPKEARVKEKLPKQASLNESLLYRNNSKEDGQSSRKDFFQCFQRLQTLREEIRSRGASFDKTTQKCQEKAESVHNTLKNGFAKILQSWRSENKWHSTSLPVYRQHGVSCTTSTVQPGAANAKHDSMRRGIWHGLHRGSNCPAKSPREGLPGPTSPMQKAGVFFTPDNQDLLPFNRRRFSSGDYSSGESCSTPTICSVASKCADCGTSMRQISEVYETIIMDDHRMVMRERKASREETSDSSSKENSFQSDTSVDSEDSFVSVIFIPKADQTSSGRGTRQHSITGADGACGANSPAVEAHSRSVSTDSTTDFQVSPPFSPPAPVSPKSPGCLTKTTAAPPVFFGARFLSENQGSNSSQCVTPHCNMLNHHEQSCKTCETAGDHLTSSHIRNRNLENLLEVEEEDVQVEEITEPAMTITESAQPVTSKDSQLHPSDLNLKMETPSKNFSSTESLERLKKQTKKRKELERLKKDAVALSARIQARISKFQESHPPPSPLFPSSFPSFSPKDSPSSLLSLHENSKEQEQTAPKTTSDSCQQDGRTSGHSPDMKVVKVEQSSNEVGGINDSKTLGRSQGDLTMSTKEGCSRDLTTSVEEENCKINKSESKEEELRKSVSPKPPYQLPSKHVYSHQVKGHSNNELSKTEETAVGKVQALRRTPVAGSGGSGCTAFAVQVLDASTANVFNPELDDVDSDVTDELTEVTEPESSSSYGSGTSMMNDEEWPPRDLEDILEVCSSTMLVSYLELQI